VSYLTPRALAALLEHLRGLGVVPPAGELVRSEVEELLGRYGSWLCSERGLAAVTARNYADVVRPFVSSRLDATGELDLRGLSAGDVLAFVLAECPHRRPGSARLLVTALRSLLGYLHVGGVIGRPLAPVVLSVAGWRLAGLPRGLEAEQVTALLDSCNLETAVGVRDLAILKLLVRLGMRRGEVAVLMLDDIDWRTGELLVRGKGSRRERLPLPVDVGDALTDYRRRARPVSAEGRAVFVRVKGAASRADPGRHQPGRDRGRPPCRSWARERARAEAHDRDRTVALRRAGGGDRAAAQGTGRSRRPRSTPTSTANRSERSLGRGHRWEVHDEPAR
jgi:integrase/recombinase XerD